MTEDLPALAPVPAGPTRMALVILTIACVIEDGTEVRHSTWVIGQTPKLAVSRWSRSHRDMASRLVETRTVTDGVLRKPPTKEWRFKGRLPQRNIQGDRQQT